ncbi:hypothetical protein [Streptomyces buecherae]|nr:hypothetical protein [Streptomyces buecherae]
MTPWKTQTRSLSQVRIQGSTIMLGDAEGDLAPDEVARRARELFL